VFSNDFSCIEGAALAPFSIPVKKKVIGELNDKRVIGYLLELTNECKFTPLVKYSP
jgi:hypothetical protein